MADDAPGDRRSLYPLLIYPAVSGLILGTAFPPLPVGLLAYIGLIPLIWSAERLQGRAAFGAGVVQGLVFYATTIYWISWITFPGMAGAILYLALFRGLFLWVLSRVVHRFGVLGLWSTPFVWVAFEYLGSIGDMGFPWTLLGVTQTAYLPLIQYAEFTGVYGVSFWIVGVNLAILAIVRHRLAAGGVALIVLFAVPALHGLLVLATPFDGRPVNVGVVQPNVSPLAKQNRGFEYNLSILQRLTRQAVARGADLVIWPETAVPAYLEGEFHRSYRDRLHAYADSLKIYLYTGAHHEEMNSPRRSYNSSFLFSPGKPSLQRYDKIKLVPFGERAPFPEQLPFLRKIRFTGGGFESGNFDSGETLTVFEGPDVHFSALICFDSVFPGFAREFVLRGAEFLVVITNDGWFGRTSGPYQHAEAAVFRAIENRRAVVRCANTGVSTLIDAAGRKDQTTDIFHEAVLIGRLSARTAKTVYTRYGDLFSQVCGLLTVVLLGLSFRGAGSAFGERSILPKTKAPKVPEQDLDSPAPEDESAMPFLDHLEELRWRILKSLSGVVVGAIVCALFSDALLRLLTLPAEDMKVPPELITLKPMGMFVVKLNIALVGGLLVALPIVFHQLWLFVAPGLYRNEKRYVVFIICSSILCFAAGAAVAYFAVIPIALGFLVGMTSGTGVIPQFDIGLYIGFVLRLLLAFGVVFELPVATFFLSKVGLLTADRMRAGRRYAILIGFVLAALLTPPDPISQLMMALPLILLYQMSIWVAKFAAR